MPKMKTHKGAAKRFKKTGTGKVARHHAFARHILTSKAAFPQAQIAPERRRRFHRSGEAAHHASLLVRTTEASSIKSSG